MKEVFQCRISFGFFLARKVARFRCGEKFSKDIYNSANFSAFSEERTHIPLLHTCTQTRVQLSNLVKHSIKQRFLQDLSPLNIHFFFCYYLTCVRRFINGKDDPFPSCSETSPFTRYSVMLLHRYFLSLIILRRPNCTLHLID